MSGLSQESILSLNKLIYLSFTADLGANISRKRLSELDESDEILSKKRKRDATTKKASILQCTQCTMKFSSLSDVISHLTVSHPELDYFACSICYNHFSSPKTTEKHLFEVHGIFSNIYCLSKVHAVVCPSNNVDHPCLKPGRSEVRTDGYKYYCPCCNSDVDTKTELEDHFAEHLNSKFTHNFI